MSSSSSAAGSGKSDRSSSSSSSTVSGDGGKPVDVLCMATYDEGCNFKPARFQRRPVGPHDVLIDMKYCGICHTDLHASAGHVKGFIGGTYPLVPGHELSGVVKQFWSFCHTNFCWFQPQGQTLKYTLHKQDSTPSNALRPTYNLHYSLMSSSVEALRRELRAGSCVLRDRGLNVANRWALELLAGVVVTNNGEEEEEEEEEEDSQTLRVPSSAYPSPDDAEELTNEENADIYALAKAYFDNREFARCAHTLDATFTSSGSSSKRSPTSLSSSSSSSSSSAAPAKSKPARAYPGKAFFLRCYALYLDGETKKETERAQGGDSLTRSRTPLNPAAAALAGDLAPFTYAAASETNAASSSSQSHSRPSPSFADPFLLYLHGVVLKELGRKEEATHLLLSSARLYPLNWSAWVDLASLLGGKADIDALELPDHWAAHLFRAHAYAEAHAHTAALRVLQPLSAIFPHCARLQASVASCLYSLRRFDAARRLFSALRNADPHRLEDADVLSNILYVQGDNAALASLAHDVFGAGRYTPQACCVVGNYYSARGEHDKAVLYFRRALSLDRNYLAAWTLSGHEYLELRNTGAAIECYRRAVESNGRDYRAWYGLGQTYELLQMYLYAAYYYRRAAALRPYDGRMWCALGACYEALERRGDAIAAYERGARFSERDGGAALKLARLYRAAGSGSAAGRWYAAYLEERDSESDGAGGGAAAGGNSGDAAAAVMASGGPDVGEALLFLARTARDEGRYMDAETYASRMLALPLSADSREARSLLAEVRHLKGEGGRSYHATAARPGSAAVAAAGEGGRKLGVAAGPTSARGMLRGGAMASTRSSAAVSPWNTASPAPRAGLGVGQTAAGEEEEEESEEDMAVDLSRNSEWERKGEGEG